MLCNFNQHYWLKIIIIYIMYIYVCIFLNISFNVRIFYWVCSHFFFGLALSLSNLPFITLNNWGVTGKLFSHLHY